MDFVAIGIVADDRVPIVWFEPVVAGSTKNWADSALPILNIERRMTTNAAMTARKVLVLIASSVCCLRRRNHLFYCDFR